MTTNPKDLLVKLSLLETQITKQKNAHTKTKYQIVSLFKALKECVSYRIPTKPIDISEDRRQFKCPKCGVILVAEEGDTVDDFDLCYVCGQIFKYEEKGENE